MCARVAIDTAFARALLDLTRLYLKCSFVPVSWSILIVYGLNFRLTNLEDIARDKLYRFEHLTCYGGAENFPDLCRPYFDEIQIFLSDKSFALFVRVDLENFIAV